MAARGSEAKNILFNQLQEFFPDSFWEDQGKILRIPMDENGTRVEIKVTLTAAKTNLGGDDAASAFAAVPQETASVNPSIEPTEEEKENVSKLLASLNF